MVTQKKWYLGDGVYIGVTFDRGLVLTTEDGISATNTIFIDSEVRHELLRYIKELEDESKAEQG